MNVKKITILLLACLSLSACKEEIVQEEKFYTFSCSFGHEINQQLMEMDSIKYLNTLGQNYGVYTLKYFISEVYLHSDIDSILIKEFHYVDATDLSTLSFTKELSAGTQFNRIHFYLGIQASKNETGVFKNPPESLMAWPVPMGGGYHYMKLEGKFINGLGFQDNYQAHTGPLAMQDYSSRQDLLIGNVIMDTQREIVLTFDVDHILNTPNTFNLSEVSGIMGNEIMQQKLHENSLQSFRFNRMK